MVGLGVRGRSADQRVEEAFILLDGALEDLVEANQEYACHVIRKICHRLEAKKHGLEEISNNVDVNERRMSVEVGEPRRLDDSRGVEESPGVEGAIFSMLQQAPDGLTVEDLVQRLGRYQFNVKRTTLIVRLRRMVVAGKLKTKTRGQYILASHTEDDRSNLNNYDRPSNLLSLDMRLGDITELDQISDPSSLDDASDTFRRGTRGGR